MRKGLNKTCIDGIQRNQSCIMFKPQKGFLCELVKEVHTVLDKSD